MTEHWDRRADIMAFIVSFREAHGYSPSVREIGAAVGLTSSNSAHWYVRRLAAEGVLRYDPRISRSIVPVDA